MCSTNTIAVIDTPPICVHISLHCLLGDSVVRYPHAQTKKWGVDENALWNGPPARVVRVDYSYVSPRCDCVCVCMRVQRERQRERESSSLSHMCIKIKPLDSFSMANIEVRKKKKGIKFKDRKESVASETTHKSSIES